MVETATGCFTGLSFLIATYPGRDFVHPKDATMKGICSPYMQEMLLAEDIH
jgi:hypothetical protein